MSKTTKMFSPVQIEFIKKELGIDLPSGKWDEIDNDILNKICDESFLIEGDESYTDDENLSERGEIAVSIVDMFVPDN